MLEFLAIISEAVLIISFIFTVSDRFEAYIRRIVQEELQKKSPSSADKQFDGRCSKCEYDLEQ
jgi:hypothetical protein